MSPPGPDWLPALLSPLKAVVELAAVLVFARGLLFALCLGRVRANIVYEGLRFLTRPVEALGAPFAARGRARLLAGSVILIGIWVSLVWAKALAYGRV